MGHGGAVRPAPPLFPGGLAAEGEDAAAGPGRTP
jgi:hypothetical protein